MRFDTATPTEPSALRYAMTADMSGSESTTASHFVSLDRAASAGKSGEREWAPGGDD